MGAFLSKMPRGSTLGAFFVAAAWVYARKWRRERQELKQALKCANEQVMKREREDIERFWRRKLDEEVQRAIVKTKADMETKRELQTAKAEHSLALKALQVEHAEAMLKVKQAEHEARMQLRELEHQLALGTGSAPTARLSRLTPSSLRSAKPQSAAQASSTLKGSAAPSYSAVAPPLVSAAAACQGLKEQHKSAVLPCELPHGCLTHFCEYCLKASYMS